MKNDNVAGENTNLIVKTTSLVMKVVGDYVNEGDFVVDCTMGKGRDTLSLAGMVGSSGHVLAMDIQEDALAATGELLMENGITCGPDSGVLLVKDSHENLSVYLSKADKRPAAIVFNLGFMPGFDKTIMTKKETTLKAVRDAIDLIRDDGIVSVTSYMGHSEGIAENAALVKMLGGLPSKKYHVAYVNMINQKKAAPSVFFITRKAK